MLLLTPHPSRANGLLRYSPCPTLQLWLAHPAFHTTWNVEFHGSDNKRIIFYSKTSGDDILLIAVNLDPFGEHSAELDVPLESLGIPEGQPYLVHDLLSEERYIWEGRKNRIVLDPHRMPAKIMAVRRRLLRENDFDYYM